MATYYQQGPGPDHVARGPQGVRHLGRSPRACGEAYGYTSLGQCALLARRLVEAGCRFVGVDHSGWDHHFTIFPSLEKDMLPHVDRAFSALVEDLDQRGMLDSTLVVMMGEMGRTPHGSTPRPAAITGR